MKISISEDTFLELVSAKIIADKCEEGFSYEKAEEIIMKQKEVDHFKDIINVLTPAEASQYFQVISIEIKMCDILKIKNNELFFKSSHTGNYCGLVTEYNQAVIKPTEARLNTIPSVMKFLRSNDTLKMFSHKTGICPSELSKVEKGKANFSHRRLHKICGITGYQLHIKQKFILTKI